MKRDAFFSDEVLLDIAGRCKFGASKPEDRIAQWNKTSPKEVRAEPHYLDDKAKMFGISGFELGTLEAAAWEEMESGTNPLLVAQYKKFLLYAKMSCQTAIDKIEKRDRDLAARKEKERAGYEGRLRQFKVKKENFIASWKDCRKSIRVRWGRMKKGLAKLLERDASLENMAERDAQLIYLLERHKVVKILENRVARVYWDRYDDIYIEDIWAILVELNSRPGCAFMEVEDD